MAVTFIDIERAASRIRNVVHRTPVLTSSILDRELGMRVWCKAENLQKTGSFKARGASNAVHSLHEAGAGVVTHSSGNHAAALAYAAASRGIPCRVVMPHTANPVKLAAVRGYGAEIVLCQPDRREETARRVQQETGAVLVHPFDDPAVIAGQGTAALELLEEVPDLDAIVAPIGGGGLLSGTALAAAALTPGAQVIGAEPAGADDAYRSLQSGVRQPAVGDPDTIADGLLTGIGELPFAILRAAGASIVRVSDADVIAAARFHLERMKIVVEPSGATPLAALRRIAGELPGARVGLILSGGNTDLSWLAGG